MKNIINWLWLSAYLFILLIAFTGCATVEKEAFMTDQIAVISDQHNKINATPVIQKVVTTIMTEFTSATDANKDGSKLWEQTVTDPDTGEVTTNTVYSQIGPIMNYLVMMKRTEIQVTMLKMVTEFYELNYKMRETPPTWIEVAKDFVKELPLIGAIGGMFGLGVEGINAAVGNISANLSDNATITTTGGVTGHRQTWVAMPPMESE